MNPEKTPKTICAVGGGKGGVGKSIFSVALATVTAQEGKKTTLVDLDLGASNLHTYLGIVNKTPTIADFILRRASTLEEILIPTGVDGLTLISGAEFVPGMANPAHWMKLKMMRHIRSLPSEVIIIDLGAGVHFNTLDFFGIADRGIVMTAPEPGAVMNAYSFIKGAMFRKVQNIFRRHPTIGPIIERETKDAGDEKKFSLPWLREIIAAEDIDMLPVMEEIADSFRPGLVVNRVPEGHRHVLVQNLITLCRQRLGIELDHLGNLPDVRDIQDHLLSIHRLVTSPAGLIYKRSVERIAGELGMRHPPEKRDYSDEEIDRIIGIINELDESAFEGMSRESWKLRAYFKTSEVVEFLRNHGVGDLGVDD